MANVTASFAISSPSVPANQPFVLTMTLANAGGAAVTVSHIEASVSPAGGSLAQSCTYSMGVPPLGPNNPVSIPAAGTLVISWPCVIFAPQTTTVGDVAVPPFYSYQINAVVTTTDTTPVIYASPGAVTVFSLIKPADQATGYPTPPNTNPGSAVFSINGNSGLLLALGM